MQAFTDRKQFLHNFLTVQESLLHLSYTTNERIYPSAYHVYAEGLIQKITLQLAAVRGMIEGHDWFSELDNRFYQAITDPLTAATISRGAYECMLTFNHVFVNPTTDDELDLRYLLWVISTQVSQLRSISPNLEASTERRVELRKKLEEGIEAILKLDIVKSLNGVSRKIITDKLGPNASDKWEYYVEGTNLKRAEGWQGLSERIITRNGVWNNTYKLFSLNAHSTWYSIDVVMNAFELTGEEPKNYAMMDTMLNTCAIVGVFVIYDYCSVFPEVKAAFDKLPETQKETINFLLNTFKGEYYQL